MNLFKLYLSDDWYHDMDASNCFCGHMGRVPFSRTKSFDDHYEVSIDLPGLDQSDLDMEVEGNSLVVKNAKKHDSDEKDNKTSVYKKFHIPDSIDVENISAEMVKGVLTISLPIKEAARPRTIAIKTG